MWSVLYVFPGGRVGAGLLLLRLGVAGSGLLLGSLSSAHAWPAIIAIATGLCLSAGLGTRVAAALGAVALPLLTLDVAPLANLILHGLGSLALALIGPGAFSIDSRLFGRRRIILPDNGDGAD